MVSPERSSKLRQEILTALFLFFLTFLLYGRAAGYGFFFLDDYLYILNNPTLQTLGPENFWKLISSVLVRNFAPLHIFSYYLDRLLFGFWAPAYHLHNLLLHGLNGYLVYLVGRQLLKSRIAGFLTSVVFLIHPVQVESVVWIAERKNLLVTAWMLLSLLFKMTGGGKDEIRFFHVSSHRIFFYLALLTRPNAVVTPFLWAFWDLSERQPLKKIFRSTLWDFVVAVLFTGMVCIIQLGEPGGGPHAHFLLPLGERLLLSLGLLLFYFKLIFWPVSLSLYYEFPLALAELLPLGVLSVVLLGLLFYVASKDREGILLFSLLSYLILLAPILNLFPITTLANDRYLYLSIVFFSFFVWRAFSLASFFPPLCKGRVGGVEAPSSTSPNPSLQRRGGKPGKNLSKAAVTHWLAISIFVAACGLMSFLTMRRVAAWEDPNALWEDTYRKAPHLSNVRRVWAERQAVQGRVDLALREFEAILSDPTLHPQDRRRAEESLSLLASDITRRRAVSS